MVEISRLIIVVDGIFHPTHCVQDSRQGKSQGGGGGGSRGSGGWGVFILGRVVILAACGIFRGEFRCVVHVMASV